jgi:hypothetical protein
MDRAELTRSDAGDPNDVIAAKNIAQTRNQPMRRWTRVPLRMTGTVLPSPNAARAPPMCSCTIAGAPNNGARVIRAV